MKKIKTNAIIEGIRSRKDRSLGMTITTPELSPTEKALFMELQGINVSMLFEPLEEQVELHEVDSDLQQKSQSQRMRSVLYILFKQDNEGYQDFANYYHAKMEKLIDYLKGKIL